MAPSFSSAKTASSFLAKEISAIYTRRGYSAAASQGSVASSARSGPPNVMLKKGSEESFGKTAWVPDPSTGYYRPENAGNTVDPVELREVLLKNNKSRSPE